MKAEVKEDWIADLRSGEYRQAKGKLKTIIEVPGMKDIDQPYEAFCCLGVLIDRQDPESWHKIDVEDSTEEVWDSPWNDGEELLNMDACNHFGLGAELMTALAGDNDTGKTFGEIADRIEREVTVDA